MTDENLSNMTKMSSKIILINENYQLSCGNNFEVVKGIVSV